MSGQRFVKLWQRNVLATPLLLAGLLIWTSLQAWPAWTGYLRTVVPAVAVGRGDTAIVDGASWRIEDIKRRRVEPKQGGLPVAEGAVFTTVVVDRSGEQELGESCTGVLTDGTREWLADLVAEVPLAEGATSICTDPGPLQFSFEIPGDVVPSALDIKSSDGRILVRMGL